MDGFNEKEITINDQIKGCIYGLAIGDALGAPVEFVRSAGNYQAADQRLVKGFTTGIKPAYTDDTELAIATARGLCRPGADLSITDPWKRSPDRLVWHEYAAWYNEHMARPGSAPTGPTTINAIARGKPGAVGGKPLNNSKGSGPVPRVAPAGLVYNSTSAAMFSAARIAALTHGHTTAQISAAIFAGVINKLLQGFHLVDAWSIIIEAVDIIPGSKEPINATNKALNIYNAGINPDKGIREIDGDGWTAESALSLGLYAAICYGDALEGKRANAFKQALLLAVNINGDSDTVGSITGALLGALYGYAALPDEWAAAINNEVLAQTCANIIKKRKGQKNG